MLVPNDTHIISEYLNIFQNYGKVIYCKYSKHVIKMSALSGTQVKIFLVPNIEKIQRWVIGTYIGT